MDVRMWVGLACGAIVVLAFGLFGVTAMMLSSRMSRREETENDQVPVRAVRAAGGSGDERPGRRGAG